MIEATLAFERPGATIVVGDRTFMGSSIVSVADNVRIGSDVLISWGVNIADHDSHSLDWAGRRDDVRNWLRGEKDWSQVSVAPVLISDKAWIGMNSIILKGVTVGEGAVVGAGSIVTKDVAPWTVVAGNPARPIRKVGRDER
jgi:acetyltransferase-like isoleucine patch superfamily enzyme